MVLPTHSSHLLVIQMVINKMSLLNFNLFLVVHEHKLAIGINVIVLSRHALTCGSDELHLIWSQTINILVSTGELLTILGSLVDDWHILQVVDVRAFYNEYCTANL